MFKGKSDIWVQMFSPSLKWLINQDQAVATKQDSYQVVLCHRQQSDIEKDNYLCNGIVVNLASINNAINTSRDAQVNKQKQNLKKLYYKNYLWTEKSFFEINEDLTKVTLFKKRRDEVRNGCICKEW